MKDIVLVGGGGHCVSCIDVVESSGEFNIIGILDSSDRLGEEILGYKIIGTDDMIPELVKKKVSFLITIGQIKNPEPRRKLFKKILDTGGNLPIIKASTAYLSKYAKIKQGTILMHNSFVNASAEIGENCIINTGAIIEHDTVVGDNCHISTSSVVNGGCFVGDNTFIGSNSVVNQEVEITNNVILASLSRIYYNIEQTGVYKDNNRR
ncbi:MAG: acetyltransferase [Candidatus Muiribacterium halophilum]|uniref:Acetyltransferase n=1 Tax=Muiribacterium halophilum TaxID=2053465 RepID=A0A2N5ZA33_MUIH1|nr:MAG: acetyltransferase [Candidatus Muirbacterium halophilum]